MNIIEVRNLDHQFSDGSFGIRHINLSIPKGSFTILAGPNGSGKTTLCLHFNGLLMPTGGEVLLNGISVSKNLTKTRQSVGMVFQNSDAQIVGETVDSDVAFGPENLSLPRKEIKRRVADALDAMGMADKSDQSPYTLSAGEKRRLSIAGVLAMKPEILIFDEPFSNLDYPTTLSLLERILDLHRAENTIFIVAHDLDKIISHADRLIVMSKGEVALDGHPSKLLESVETYGVEKPCVCKVRAGQ